MQRVKSAVILITAALFSCSWMGCAGGGSSGIGSTPTLPAQIPTSVEYAGETIAGDISVQTGQTALFTVTDADGNVVDPILVTAELSEPTASISAAKGFLPDINLGSFSIEDDYLVYTASNYLPPNQMGQVTAQFSYNGEVLGTSDLKISPSYEDINANKYKFTDVYTTEDEPDYPLVGYPDIAVDGLGNVYACFLYQVQVDLNDGKGGTRTDTMLALKRGSYSESGSVGIEWQADKLITALTGASATFCSVTVLGTSGTGGDTKVALAWARDSGLRTNGYSRLIVSADGGENFSDPVAIDYSVYDAVFDSAGRIHMAAIDIEGCPGGPLYGVKYLLYDGSTVTDRGTVNNESSCTAGNEHKPGIAASSDGETAYLIWSDSRASGQTPPALDTYVAIVKSSGVAEIKLRPDACESAACLGGGDLIIGFDRLGQPIASWNEFITDTWPLSGGKSLSANIDMKTYLAVLNPVDNQPEYTLLATTANFDLSQPLYFSRNSVVADYANNYHIFFRDQEAIRYVMMRTADGLITTPVVPTDEAIGSNGRTSAAADRSGRTYLLWQAGAPLSSSAFLTVGTSSSLLE